MEYSFLKLVLCAFFFLRKFHLSLVLWCVTNLFFVMFFPIICIYFFIGVYFSFYTPTIVAMFGVFHLLFFLKDFKKFYSFPFICWKNPRFLTKSILLWYENLFKVSNFYCDRWKREGERDLRMTESRIFLSMNNNNWKWKREFSRIYLCTYDTACGLTFISINFGESDQTPTHYTTTTNWPYTEISHLSCRNN